MSNDAVTAYTLGILFGLGFFIVGYSALNLIKLWRSSRKSGKKIYEIVKGREYFKDSKVSMVKKDFSRMLYSKPVVLLAIILEIVICILCLILVVVFTFYFSK